MKAAVIYRYGGPEAFRIEEVPAPVIKPNEILIRVRAAGVNPIDWKQRMGHHRLFLKATFPLITGYDVAGIVEETGNATIRFKPGDRVFARCDRRFGQAYAEYAATSEGTAAIIPEGLDFIQAAAIPMAAVTALQALRDKTQIRPGDRMLIIGAAGGVGHFALQLGKAFGAEVTAVCSSRHADMMQELAPDHFIDYTVTDILTLPGKYDVIFDAAAIYSYLSCRKLLDKRGIYINTKPRPKMIAHKMVALVYAGTVRTLLMKSRATDLDEIIKLIEAGRLRVIIDSVFLLDQISEAHKRAESYHSGGKIVIEMPKHAER
jgi:NADPH:quinone reductase-like Zn-dependent oxidoreductase